MTTGKPLGEEVWQTFKYDTAGRLLEFRRGRGQKLENHSVSGYDASGRLIRREIRQGEKDILVYTEKFRYTGDPSTVERTVVLPSGKAREPSRFRLDAAGRAVELWSEEGYHVCWKYDAQGRVVEQTTGPYKVQAGQDSFPIPGKIQTRYEGTTREQVFFSTGGKALFRRVAQMERDGSIASIRYEAMPGTRAEDAPDLYRLLAVTTPHGGRRYTESVWDDHGNWTERRGCFQPGAGGVPVLQSVCRRTITYR